MKVTIALVFLLVAFTARADPPGLEGQTQAASNAAIRFSPPLDKVMARAMRYGHRVSTSVTVSYDDLGNILSVRLDKPTGDTSLDKAILAWAAGVKIQADGAGSGTIPVKIKPGG